MKSIAVLVAGNETSPSLPQLIDQLGQCSIVKTLAITVSVGATTPLPGLHAIKGAALWSKKTVLDVLEWFHGTGASHLLIITGSSTPCIFADGLHRMVSAIDDIGASVVYGDYFDRLPDGSMHLHQLIDYQPGSIRDTFDFGSALLINGRFTNSIMSALVASNVEISFGGLYDTRLRLSEHGPIVHLAEPLYSCDAPLPTTGNQNHFSYVDPRNRSYQLEMEQIVTDHLCRIRACLAAPSAPLVKIAPTTAGTVFPVMTSVVIPVKNRSRTIADAVHSALSQETSFPFNVIVIDNHSTDETTALLKKIAADDCRLVHIIPERTDLLIGGCWNEAIYSAYCGEYAVQLDSDDLYDGKDVLARIMAEFAKQPYALVIGSYTTVNFNLKPLPPGLVDHREWTDDNGMNNALRIAGLGAPRAYHVPTLRQFGFPNVSYGEDYAVVLRLSRSYKVGRIYDSLYWCRRWDENSDNKLLPETANRYDFYKDRLRSIELAARIRTGNRI